MKLLALDYDGVLAGEHCGAQELARFLANIRSTFTLAINSGRSVDELQKLASQLPKELWPDVFLGGLGTEVYCHSDAANDLGLSDEIEKSGWNRDIVEDCLSVLSLAPQRNENQSPYKLSYTVFDDTRVKQATELLLLAKVPAKLVYSHGKYLDVIPASAGKGPGVELLRRWLTLEPRDVVVSGDSLNDADMLRSGYYFVLPSNAESSLRSQIHSTERTFLATQPCSYGVLQGLRYWQLVG